MDIDEDGELVLKATGWDKLYIPPAEESKYAIRGKETQLLSIKLGNDESIQSEPGTMVYFTDGTKATVSCEGFCGRCCAGEACYVVNYANDGRHSDRAAYVGLSPTFPTAKVVPVDLSSADVGGSLICQQGAFMASYGDVTIASSFDFNLKRCCCAGLGLVRQNLKGSGIAFLAATGTIVQKVLLAGEVIVVDTNCVLAFAKSAKLDVKKAGGIIGMIGGGEGIFNTTLTGPGLVLIQSMNEIMFREALVADKMYRR
jgi:uncharacterized protein (AIM24 family)